MWQKTAFICRTIKQKGCESGGLDAGGVKAENTRADSRFPVVRMSAFALEEQGEEVQPKQKHHFKAKTNKSAVDLMVKM